ncbi:MAG: GWxTD domain-containing protein [Candidatus Aminicenantes bacterium]|nr:MAG: GWxTD domain-containing protein [Candidatus Aminicenantes bacterium]
MKKYLTTILALSLVFLILNSCRFSRIEKDLSPEHGDFLSKVRYIITKKERKLFLNLPFSERENFIKEFWKKRDPDPETEVNEFKERYFKRIEEANHLFKEGGTPGWLQDRGRIYILLGPPEGREKYPTGYTFDGRPMEIWYYGVYPIIFIDYSYVGDYELYILSAQHVAQLLKASIDLKPEVKMEGLIFDFDLNLEKLPGNKINVQIKVQYKNIWLVERDDKLETTLLLSLEVFSDSKKKVWDFNEEYSISLGQNEIMGTLGKSYVIPVDIELSQGKYRMKILLENKTDGKKVQKTINFDL